MFKKVYRPERKDKIRILVEGWFNIPHSYSLVVCNELLALERNHGSKLQIFTSEQEYFKPEWNKQKKLMYTNEKNNGISKFQKYNGEPIDLVYRIVYPYNLINSKYNRYNNKYIPTIVFYTAEFANLDASYFSFDKNLKFVDDNFITSFLENNPCYYFKTPSVWNLKGMKKYLTSEWSEAKKGEPSRNRVITHGVDTGTFYPDTSNRSKLRKDWGFGENDLVLMTGGALTRNKGIPEVLMLLHLLVFKDNLKNTRLLLKGSSQLYPSKELVDGYLDDLVSQKLMTQQQRTELVDRHIKFLPNIVSENGLRHLYNAVDVYVSPYLAEGFNLMVLEAIACASRVLVSNGGSTDDFTHPIQQEIPGAKNYVYTFETTETGIDKKHLVIDIRKLYSKFKDINFTVDPDYNKQIQEYISKKKSWDAVSDDMFDMMNELYQKYKTIDELDE